MWEFHLGPGAKHPISPPLPAPNSLTSFLTYSLSLQQDHISFKRICQANSSLHVANTDISGYVRPTALASLLRSRAGPNRKSVLAGYPYCATARRPWWIRGKFEISAVWPIGLVADLMRLPRAKHFHCLILSFSRLWLDAEVLLPLSSLLSLSVCHHCLLLSLKCQSEAKTEGRRRPLPS